MLRDLELSFLETAALVWLRYRKRCAYICTEYVDGRTRADIIGSDGARTYEIEIKRSIQDFNNDFKKSKHRRIESLLANRQYFLVPFALERKALELLSTQDESFGLLSCELTEMGFEREFPIRCVKPAKPIHSRKITPIQLHGLVMRMASDVISTHMRLGAVKTCDRHLRELAKLYEKKIPKQELVLDAE